MSASFAYDDITIGQAFPGPEVHVTREMIREFAAASFDHNPLHWDDAFMDRSEFAGNKNFDDVIGHGLMTYSLMTRAMTDWLWPDNGDHCRLETPIPAAGVSGRRYRGRGPRHQQAPDEKGKMGRVRNHGEQSAGGNRGDRRGAWPDPAMNHGHSAFTRQKQKVGYDCG